MTNTGRPSTSNAPLKRSSIQEAIVIGSDDDSGDEREISFVGSTRSIKPLSTGAGQAIVIRSDSEDEDDGLQSMDTLIEAGGGHRDLRPKAGVSSRLIRSATSISASFPGIDSDDEPSDEPPRAQTCGTAKRRKLNDDEAVTRAEQTLLADKAQRAIRKQQEQQEKQLARAAAKATKEAEKSFQRKVTEVNRLRTSKNEAVREINLYMSADMALPTSPISGALPEIQARFTESLSDIHFMSGDESPVPGAIRIKRHIKARWDPAVKRFIPLDKPYWEWDNTILLVIDAEEVVDKMLHGQDMLLDWIQDARLLLGLDLSVQIVVLVKGLGRYQAKTKTLANREFTAMARAGLSATSTASDVSAAPATRLAKDLIERNLIELQVQEGVFIVHGAVTSAGLMAAEIPVEKTEDMEDWVWNLCADVALRPYKLLSKAHLSFAPVEPRRKAASTTDALELILQEVQGVTQSAAAGVAAEYPTFAELMRAFEKAERQGSANVMLADCEIRNLINGTASGRKLNKALAKRVYQTLRGEDSLALA